MEVGFSCGTMQAGRKDHAFLDIKRTEVSMWILHLGKLFLKNVGKINTYAAEEKLKVCVLTDLPLKNGQRQIFKQKDNKRRYLRASGRGKRKRKKERVEIWVITTEYP